jgi:pimeloyl-ACP methyl ester carboxylesterase
MGIGAVSSFTWSTVALAAVLVTTALVLLGGSPAPASAQSTVWLCRPGTDPVEGVPDPCESNRTATVVTYSGSTRHEAIEQPAPSNNAPVDCFYVYPTVSEQETNNANYEVEQSEIQIAIDQASRFSQVCKVYAPIYPQLTLHAEGEGLSEIVEPYEAVLSAFKEYMSSYNDGRGIVLIGHSQGAAVLKALLRKYIEKNATIRSKLVSAIILGGQVEVPEGALTGGSFEKTPLCQQAAEIECVIAYSSFLNEPKWYSLFVHPAIKGWEVACVNPTITTQDGAAGWLLPYAPTTRMPGENAPPVPEAATPWVAEPGLAEARCEHKSGSAWLRVLPAATSEAVVAERKAKHEWPEEPKPLWGLHLYDVNEALGNLVDTVATEEQTYEAK